MFSPFIGLEVGVSEIQEFKYVVTSSELELGQLYVYPTNKLVHYLCNVPPEYQNRVSVDNETHILRVNGELDGANYQFNIYTTSDTPNGPFNSNVLIDVYEVTKHNYNNEQTINVPQDVNINTYDLLDLFNVQDYGTDILKFDILSTETQNGIDYVYDESTRVLTVNQNYRNEEYNISVKSYFVDEGIIDERSTTSNLILAVNELPPLEIKEEFKELISYNNLTKSTISCNVSQYININVLNPPNVLYSVKTYDIDINTEIGNYNNGLPPIDFTSDNKLVVNPEYRNKTYYPVLTAYVENYGHTVIDLNFKVHERVIEPIVYNLGNDYVHSNHNLVKDVISYNNLSSYFNYPYAEFLQYSTQLIINEQNTNAKPLTYEVKDNNSMLEIIADVRDMDYTIVLKATDTYFGCNLSLIKFASILPLSRRLLIKSETALSDLSCSNDKTVITLL